MKICFTPYTFGNTSTHITFQMGNLLPGETLSYSTPAKFPDVPTNEKTMENILPILNRIIIHPESKAFLRPVDPILDKADNYKQIITSPIDLSKILQRANSNDYKKFSDFISDLKLLITNAITYNNFDQHPVHKSAVNLSNYISELLIRLNDNPDTPINKANENHISKEAEKQIADALNSYAAQKKRLSERKQIDQEKIISVQPQSKKVSDKDIQFLESGIRNLRGIPLMSVYEIIENKQFHKDVLPYEVNFKKCDSTKIKKLKKLIKHGENYNKISYVWAPAIPDDLQEIKDKYESEFMNWLKPPPPTSIQ